MVNPKRSNVPQTKGKICQSNLRTMHRFSSLVNGYSDISATSSILVTECRKALSSITLSDGLDSNLDIVVAMINGKIEGE